MLAVSFQAYVPRKSVQGHPTLITGQGVLQPFGEQLLVSKLLSTLQVSQLPAWVVVASLQCDSSLGVVSGVVFLRPLA